MKPIKIFKIGSSCFFKEHYPDYVEKDLDELQIMDSFVPGTNVLNLKDKGTGKDVFFWRNMDKDGFINDCLESKVPMRAGKFLIKEFAEYIDLTINDLRKLDSSFKTIDDKHTYEKIIYEAYLKNNGFYLTDEQRDRAYKEYKRKRPEIYGRKS